MRICPACGGRNFSPTPPTQGATAPTPPQTAAGKIQSAPNVPQQTNNTSAALVGVRGWLLFLCVSLTILTPLLALVTLVSEWSISKPYFERIPNLKNGIIFEIATYSATALFAVYAGSRLWSIRPNAVKTAKIYLIVQLLVAIIVPIVVVSIINTSGNLPGAVSAIIKSAMTGIFYFAVWYPYLSRSKRVKATYL